MLCELVAHSLELPLPQYLRQFFIVTDNQKPGWMEYSQSKGRN